MYDNIKNANTFKIPEWHILYGLAYQIYTAKSLMIQIMTTGLSIQDSGQQSQMPTTIHL